MARRIVSILYLDTSVQFPRESLRAIASARSQDCERCLAKRKVVYFLWA
jgi:hypothetical protein